MTSEKQNIIRIMFLLSLVLLGGILLGDIKLVLPLLILGGITLIVRWASPFISSKTNWPYASAAIHLILFAIFIGWFNWQGSQDQSLVGLLKAIGGLILTIGAVAFVPLGIYGMMFLWKKYFPSEQLELKAEENEEFTKSYNKWYLLGIAGYWIAWPITGYISFLIMSRAGDWYYANIIRGIIVEPVDHALWGFVALFAGMLFGMWAVEFLLRFGLKDKYEKFSLYYDARMGFNNKKAGRTIVIFSALFLIIMVYINLTIYTRFTDSEIRIHRPYWITEQVHTYQDVVKIEQRITKRDNGEDSIFIISFKDGMVWRTTSYHENSIPAYYPKIIEFVSAKSGIPIEYIVSEAN